MSSILSVRGISKRFPGVQALDNVDLEVKKGEVHALIGENGAGKSTLVKILSGAYAKDAGLIEIDGKAVDISSPKHAQSLGISIIYQELDLIESLTVAENVFMGRHIMRNAVHIAWSDMYTETQKLLDSLDISMDPFSKVKELGIAQQQMVEVAKALSVNSKIIIMDEPSASLTTREIENLFKAIKRLKSNGVSIIYISHRLEELREICDRSTVMRDGKAIATVNVKDSTVGSLIKLMVGRELKEKFPKAHIELGRERFRVEDLNCGKTTRGVSFSVKAGEILGIGGLMGAGRTETARAIFGLEKGSTGKIFVDNVECAIRTPLDAIKAGIGFATEDRKSEGLVLSMDVGANITIASLNKFEKYGFHINIKNERSIAEDFVKKLRIKTPSMFQKARNLSGGNQQKIVLAKWMLRDSKVVIFDEPTRGIDVNAKIEVYALMNDLVKSGKAILFISSEMPELLGMCDRIVVMHDGKITGDLLRSEATQEKVLQLATGGN